jgi:hypothetical protein
LSSVGLSNFLKGGMRFLKRPVAEALWGARFAWEFFHVVDDRIVERGPALFGALFTIRWRRIVSTAASLPMSIGPPVPTASTRSVPPCAE